MAMRWRSCVSVSTPSCPRPMTKAGWTMPDGASAAGRRLVRFAASALIVRAGGAAHRLAGGRRCALLGRGRPWLGPCIKAARPRNSDSAGLTGPDVPAFATVLLTEWNGLSLGSRPRMGAAGLRAGARFQRRLPQALDEIDAGRKAVFRILRQRPRDDRPIEDRRRRQVMGVLQMLQDQLLHRRAGERPMARQHFLIDDAPGCTDRIAA